MHMNIVGMHVLRGALLVKRLQFTPHPPLQTALRPGSVPAMTGGLRNACSTNQQGVCGHDIRAVFWPGLACIALLVVADLQGPGVLLA